MRLATKTDIELSKAKDDMGRLADMLRDFASAIAENSKQSPVLIPEQRDAQTIPVPVPMPTQQPVKLEAAIIRDETGRASRIVITPYYV